MLCNARPIIRLGNTSYFPPPKKPPPLTFCSKYQYLDDHTKEGNIIWKHIKHLLPLCLCWMCGSGGWYWKGRARGCGSICIDYPFLDPKKINPTEGNTAINPSASAEVVFLPWRRVLVLDTIIFHFHFFFKFFILLLFPQPLASLSINWRTMREKLSLIEAPCNGPSMQASLQSSRWPYFLAGKMGRAMPREQWEERGFSQELHSWVPVGVFLVPKSTLLTMLLYIFL